MKIAENQEAKTAILQRFSLAERRKGIHISDLDLCLRKTYFRAVSNIPPTEDDLLFWLLGKGYHSVLEGKAREIELEADGILATPDEIVLHNNKLCPVEYKSTRQSSKKDITENFWWLTRLMGYSYICHTDIGRLAVFHLVGDWKNIAPRLFVYDFEFTPYEIQKNWEQFVARKDILSYSLTNKIPPPSEKVPGWLCKTCVVKEKCLQ